MNNQLKLLDHPFWHKLLNIKGGSAIIKHAIDLGFDAQGELLNTVVKGFYPLTALSPLVFRKVAELTDGDARKLAYNIYEVEQGLYPLVKGTCYDNVVHAEQFRILIQSLLPHYSITPPKELIAQFFSAVNPKELNLSQALAIVNVIEHCGPHIIYNLQDFIAKWQVLTSMSSKDIKQNFVLEHGLIEGEESDDQHINMVDKILKQYKNKIDVSEYQAYTEYFIACYHQLMDLAYQSVPSITEVAYT